MLGLTDLNLWVSTVMMGISWSLVPAVIWPATTLIVEPRRLGTALGLITLIQALGMAASNLAAGWLADQAGAGAAESGGLLRDAVVLLPAEPDRADLGGAAVAPRNGPLGHGLEAARASAPAPA